MEVFGTHFGVFSSFKHLLGKRDTKKGTDIFQNIFRSIDQVFKTDANIIVVMGFEKPVTLHRILPQSCSLLQWHACSLCLREDAVSDITEDEDDFLSLKIMVEKFIKHLNTLLVRNLFKTVDMFCGYLVSPYLVREAGCLLFACLYK